jgi:hypothetical protein
MVGHQDRDATEFNPRRVEGFFVYEDMNSLPRDHLG